MNTLDFLLEKASDLHAEIPKGLQNKHRVNTTTLNVRSGPGTTYSIMRQLHTGDVVNVISIEGDWAKVSSYEYVFLGLLEKV